MIAVFTREAQSVPGTRAARRAITVKVKGTVFAKQALLTNAAYASMKTLHPTKSVKVLQPHYTSQFACIGPSCEDNCCTGWTVHIDKKTFTAYRQSQVPELKERFDSKLKRIRSQESDARYARIEMNSGSTECPFLEDKLCSVQRELGEDKLSNTCATYPRNTRWTGNYYEQALSLSCPEAARLALLDANAMDFVEGSVLLRPESVSPVQGHKGLSDDLKQQIRIVCLQVVKDEGLALWQKMAALGVFCEQLSASIHASEFQKIPAVIEEFLQVVQSGAIAQALEAMQPDYFSQAATFTRLWQLRIGSRHSPVQEQVQKAVAVGLGADPETQNVTVEKLVEQYRLGVQNLPAALQSTPFMLEHYVLNDMFNENFPFAEKDPFDSYLRLVTRFGIVRLMLAAQCSDASRLPEPTQLARTIQVFCRRYQHDGSFAKTVHEAFDKTGLRSLEKIYRFLRS